MISRHEREALLIEPDYRGSRIAVDAQQADDACEAKVRLRRTLSETPGP